MRNGLMLIVPGTKTNRKGKKSRRTYIPKGSKVDKSLSSPEETVYRTSKGKIFRQMTPHGKFKRNQMELENNCNVYTGEVLTDYQRGQRAGYNQALGEQAKYYKGKKMKK